jgi:hypothetical protein
MEKQKLKAIFHSFMVSLLFVLHFYVAKDVLKSVHPNIRGGFRGLVGGIALCLISLNKVPELFEYSMASGRQAFNVVYEVVFSTALTY